MEIFSLHLTSKTSGNALPEVFSFLWIATRAGERRHEPGTAPTSTDRRAAVQLTPPPRA
jgi:hypothetical protein